MSINTNSKYLEYGIFAHGFARARCGDCGHDYFVVFSCATATHAPASLLWSASTEFAAQGRLDRIGVQSEPPRIASARGPPLWDDCDAQMGEGVEGEPDWDLAAQPAPAA